MNLLFPALPALINNKLVFTLCYKCAEEKLSLCDHSVSERSIEGTWVTEEVKLAVKEGYAILEIYSVWHWKNTSNELFSDYVNTF